MHIIVTLFGFSEVFGDGLSSFGNSVFGQLTRKEEATGRLNFSYSDPRSFCLSLRMVSQSEMHKKENKYPNLVHC